MTLIIFFNSKNLSQFRCLFHVRFNPKNKKINNDDGHGDGMIHVHRYAQYSHFKIYSEADYYKLEIDGYEGNAGDSLNDPWYGSNNSPFSTYNRDNDRSSLNCASMLKVSGPHWPSIYLINIAMILHYDYICPLTNAYWLPRTAAMFSQIKDVERPK